MRSLYLTIAIVIFSFIAVQSQSFQVVYTSDSSSVKIHRDDYGVPHIYADNEYDMFFGQGFATAQDRLIQLEMHRRTAMGTIAEVAFVLDAYVDYLIEDDIETRKDGYTKQELREIFFSLDKNYKQSIIAYSSGINRYVDSMKANPDKYMHYEYRQLTQIGMEIDDWTPINTMAIISYMSRIFGGFGGDEFYNQSVAEDMGFDTFKKIYPLNDTSVYATVHGEMPGKIKSYDDPQKTGSELKNAKEYYKFKASSKKFKKENHLPYKFGSFAAIVDKNHTNDENTLFLGCPQMGSISYDEPAVINEVELKAPGYHVHGAAVTGIPGIIVGRTTDFAWTFTSGLMDNSDFFADSINKSYDDFDKYYFNGEWKDAEIITDTVKYSATPFATNDKIFEIKRTVHGPVKFPVEIKGDTFAASLKYTFWKEEFLTWQTLYDLPKSGNFDEVLNAVSKGNISFNFFYADTDHNIHYKLTGKYPKRDDGVDPRFFRRGTGEEEWTGFIPFGELPSSDMNAQNYYINWNNKPADWWDQGDNLPWLKTSHTGTIVEAMENFLAPKPAVSYEHIKAIPEEIDAHGSYQQALTLSEFGIDGVNILPPGQSQFTDINGDPSPHNKDQYDLYANFEYKDMLWNYKFTGVEDKKTGSTKVSVYPQPAREFVVFNLTNVNTQRKKIRKTPSISIYDFAGKEIVSKQKIGYDNRFVWSFVSENGKNYGSGVYFYEIQTGSDILKGKFIKK